MFIINGLKGTGHKDKIPVIEYMSDVTYTKWNLGVFLAAHLCVEYKKTYKVVAIITGAIKK